MFNPSMKHFKMCQSCEEEFEVTTVRNATKFCKACSVAIGKVRAKIYEREKKEAWNNLAEEKKFELMDKISKKILNGEL